MNNRIKLLELRELQPILRRAFDDRLIVVRYTTEHLLPFGENYGSTILSVHAVIKRDNTADEEDLHLIAKMQPPVELLRKIFDSPYTFRKEIFMYETILPLYNQLERDAGLKEDELFDILPKYYQSRLSLNPETDFDDDAVILMENLKMRGYYIGDRTKGYDLEHSKAAIRAMARFHGLGMAMKYKRPEQFEEIKKRSKCLDHNISQEQNLMEAILNKLAEDPDTAVYIDRCRAAVSVTMQDLFTAVPTEPWSTIVHSDFWVNNIMFHRSENGRVDDVKFVDFQNFLFLSPLNELIFYLFSSTEEEMQDDHIERLIDMYYETLLAVLDRLGCDTRPLVREDFDAKLQHDAKFEFTHLCFILKIIMLDTKRQTQWSYDKLEQLFHDLGNQTYYRRLRQIVLRFVKRNWL